MAREEASATRRTDRADPGFGLMEQLRDLRKPIAGETSLSQAIPPLVREGELYEQGPDGKVHCYACGHNCTTLPGARGICQVRYNLGGTLYVPWG
jgi:hypothetical protein